MTLLFHRSRFLRFIVVGAINTVVGYLLYFLALLVGAHYSVAVAIATVLGVLFNFKSTGRMVFGSRDNSRLFRFIVVYGVLYCVNVAGVGSLIAIGISAWLSGLLLTPPIALASYFLNSRFVFSP